MFGLKEIKEDIATIKLQLSKKPDMIDKPTLERIADLEVKMAKLWGLLLETNPKGGERKSKFGKLYGGRLKTMPENIQGRS